MATTQLDEELLEENLLDRPIANLKDLQYTYGVIAMAAYDFDHPEFESLTPFKTKHLIDKENTVIALKIDFTGEEPSYEGLNVTNYDKSMIGKVAHSHNDASRGADYSITHLVGKSPSDAKIKKYAVNRLTRWTTDETVQRVADEHEDGYIIDGLVDVGEDNGVEKQILQDIKSELPSERGGDYQPLVTVKIKRAEEYKWSGEVDVLNKAMTKLKKFDASDASAFNNNALGEAKDYVTGETGEVVGVSTSPLRHYKTKQQSTFQGLSPEESSWLNNPITYESNVFIESGAEFIQYSYETVSKHRVYYLPYIKGTIGVEEAKELYRVLTEAENQLDDDEIMKGNAATSYVDYISAEREFEDGEKFAYYVIMLEYDQDTLYNFTAEIPHVPQLWFEKLAKSHIKTVNILVHDGDSSGTFRDWDNDNSSGDLYDFTQTSVTNFRNVLRCIASGLYTSVSLPTPDGDDDFSENEFYAKLYQAILERNNINAELLLEKQVEHLLSEEGERFPDRHVANQWIRMVVLRNSGLLSAQDASLVEKDSLESLSTNDNMNVPETYHEAVEQSLDNFVKSSPSLNENKDRKAVFAVGAMVGALSKYQRRQRGLSQRLVDKHPISRMGPQRLQQAFTDGVDIATTYGGAEDRDIDMVQDTYVEFAQDALQDVSIDSLSLSNADIKYHYSLGVSYALNVYVEYDDSNDDNS